MTKPFGSTLLAPDPARGAKLNMLAPELAPLDCYAAGNCETDTKDAGSSQDYAPPYQYDKTDAADCATLTKMIQSVNSNMLVMRMPQAQMDVYQAWLTYANNRLGLVCKVETPADGPVKNPPILGDAGDLTHTTTADALHETLSGPSGMPYPMGGGGGGSDSSTATPEAKKKNWYWVVLAGVTVAGFFMFKKPSL